MTHEWDAGTYHRVSGPQTGWGRKVLDRLTLCGDERVVDAGCGTGRLTGELMERLPRGAVLAIDRSWNMLVTARTNLRPSFGRQVAFAQVALPAIPVRGWADLVFSTATFHWVADHPALFESIHAALRPGGRLVAQCGGAGNLNQAHALAQQASAEPPFACFFPATAAHWNFASAELTAERLRATGFAEVQTWTEPAPVHFTTAGDYREFVATVVYRPHLASLPTPALQTAWLDRVCKLAAATDPPFLLDYVRLNLSGRRLG